MTATTDPAELVRVKILDHGQLCRHEAGHAAGGLLAGLDVRYVRAPYRTAADAHGVPASKTGLAVSDHGDLRAVAVSNLCGPIFEGQAPPPWPIPPAPLPTTRGSSARSSKNLGRSIGRAITGWSATRSTSPAAPWSRKLAGLIADRLEELEEIGAEELDRLRAIAEDTMEYDTSPDEGAFEYDDAQLDAEAVAAGRELGAELKARMRADRNDETRRELSPWRAGPSRSPRSAAEPMNRQNHLWRARRMRPR